MGQVLRDARFAVRGMLKRPGFTVLVVATPCPLLLAIPVAIIGAISVAAGRAIIIKNPACVAKTYPNFFEDLERLR